MFAFGYQPVRPSSPELVMPSASAAVAYLSDGATTSITSHRPQQRRIRVSPMAVNPDD
jgi:hypothetical protein